MQFSQFLLKPLSGLYGFVLRLRNRFYDREWLEVTSFAEEILAISIGNITAGGTGKTPMAEYLLEFLEKEDLKPAYLSRGYGRNTRGFLRVMVGGLAEEFGDEAVQVADKFPHLQVVVCEDRAKGVEYIIREEPTDVVVMDDAFQHRAVDRQIELVMIDATRPPHEDAMLPLGRLREPLEGLERADMFVVNKCMDAALFEQVKQNLPDRPVGWVDMELRDLKSFLPLERPLQLSELKDRPVCGFCGIGNPDFFRETLDRTGAKIEGWLPFPDHHTYRGEDLGKILRKFAEISTSKGMKPWLLTTEKDYFRLRGSREMDELRDIPVYYVRAGLKWKAGLDDLKAIVKAGLSPAQS